jgi:hypothetical protein
VIVIEKTSNGRTIVTIKRDWHQGRIGLAYIPRVRMMDAHEIKWQKALCKQAGI